MTGDGTQFGSALAGSMLLHATLFFFLFALPAGVPDTEMVRIYRVNVVEAPQQPRARRLDVSTQPISELRLEAPSLKVEAAPAMPAAAPSAPLLRPSPTVPVPTALPPPAAPAARGAPAMAPANLPALPQAPSIAPAEPAPPKAPAATTPPALPPAAREQAGERSPLERVRSKVERSKARLPEPAPPIATPGGKRVPHSRISLRVYQASVQEEVQRKYKFPGGFDKNLWVRVRLVIARDGRIRSITFLERSGNEHFDRAALLSIRRTKLPPIPDGIEGDSISQVVLFRP